MSINTDLLVIGAGPGGYAAAFRASDLGKKVTIIEKEAELGGVCLNKGCIPSKTLLHLGKVVDEALGLKNQGITFSKPKIEYKKIQSSKNKIIKKLNAGIKYLAKQRNVNIIQGEADFISDSSVKIKRSDKSEIISFEHCVVATGSRPKELKNIIIDHKNILDSTSALNLGSIPKKILIIGGGYIGLEMGSIFSSMGSNVTIAEFMPTLLPMADQDLVSILKKKLDNKFESILMNTSVSELKQNKNSITATLNINKEKTESIKFDKVLVSIGRTPNTDKLSLDSIGIEVDGNGFIIVDEYQRTNIPNIMAIGDVTGDPMLAHKAAHEGKVAAEVSCNIASAFKPNAIPAVIFTDPEIAWAGKTEQECANENIEYEKGEFPWQASGRATSISRNEGKTKILFEPETRRVIGVGIVGVNAGDLIGEGVLAIEMGACSEDISLSIHPHPTLTETFANAAEVLEGTATDIFNPGT